MINWFNHIYPYTNFHELNLDWVIATVRHGESEIANFIGVNTIKYADPILWNIESQYEANTVVVDAQTGNAYISTKPVPMGVHLSRTDYWTQIYNYADVVDGLRSQIASNEKESTTATQSYSKGALVFINGLLYRVTHDMIAGDSFVVDSNCVKTTIEAEIKRIADELQSIGDLAALDTEDKTSIVAAINEVLTTLNNFIGDLDALDTEDKTNVVNAINEIVNNFNLLNESLFVSVIDYGAKGDGITDDTEAFQAALDSGKHVFIPVSKGQKYVITDTLNITTWQQVIFSEFKNTGAGYINLANTLPLGGLYFNPLTPCELFNGVDATGTKFYNINANTPCNQINSSSVYCSNDFYVGSFGEIGSRANDLDVVFNNCFLFGFKTAIFATGRGVDIQNCWFASCEVPIKLGWIDQTGQSYLIDNESGMRNIIIKNNRFHCVNTNCIVVNGACQPNGMEICDNVSDMGGANFMLANQATLRNCKITGNIIKHTINSTTPPIYIYKVLGCNIENNVFYNNSDYGDFRCTRIIHVGNGASKSQGLIISNNRINYSLNDIITLQDVNDAVISNNQLTDIHASDSQQLASVVNIVGGTFDRLSIVSNSIEFKTATNYVLRSSIAIRENTLRYCRIGLNAGNYGSIMDAQHDWSVLSDTNVIER